MGDVLAFSWRLSAESFNLDNVLSIFRLPGSKLAFSEESGCNNNDETSNDDGCEDVVSETTLEGSARDVPKDEVMDDEIPTAVFEPAESNLPCLMYVSDPPNNHATSPLCVKAVEIVSNATHLEFYTSWPKGDYLGTSGGTFLQDGVFLFSRTFRPPPKDLVVKFVGLKPSGEKENAGPLLTLYQASVHLDYPATESKAPTSSNAIPSPPSPLPTATTRSESSTSVPTSTTPRVDLDAAQRLVASMGLPLSPGALQLMQSVRAAQNGAAAPSLPTPPAFGSRLLAALDARMPSRTEAEGVLERMEGLELEENQRRLSPHPVVPRPYLQPEPSLFPPPPHPPLLRPHLEAMEARIMARVDERLREMQRRMDDKLDRILDGMRE